MTLILKPLEANLVLANESGYGTQEEAPLDRKVEQVASAQLSNKNEIDRWLRSNAEGKSGRELEEVLIEAKSKYAAIQINYPCSGMIGFLNAGKDPRSRVSVSPNFLERHAKTSRIKPLPEPNPEPNEESEDRRKINEWLAEAAGEKSDKELESVLKEAQTKFADAGSSFSLRQIYSSLRGLKKRKPWKAFLSGLHPLKTSSTKQKEPDPIPNPSSAASLPTPAATPDKTDSSTTSGKSDKIPKPLKNCQSEKRREINEWFFGAAEGKSDEEIALLLGKAKAKFKEIGSFFTDRELYNTLAAVKKRKPWDSFLKGLPCSEREIPDLPNLFSKREDPVSALRSEEPSSSPVSSLVPSPGSSPVRSFRLSSGRDCRPQQEILEDRQRINRWLLADAEGKSGEELNELFEAVQAMYCAIGIQIPIKGVAALLAALRSSKG